MNSLGSICVVLLGLPSWADPIVPTKGTFVFTPKGDQSKIPAVYQLGEKQFEFKMLLKDRKENLGVLVHEVTFPSPYVSPHPENNTIWCEFYQPIGLQKGPGVVILDILGGIRAFRAPLPSNWPDKEFTRFSCNWPTTALENPKTVGLSS